MNNAQITTDKQPQTSNLELTKPFDLEERTLQFAGASRDWAKRLPRTVANQEYIRQFIRSSSSIGANYIEATEALSKKDFALRLRISRKEAKETCYWLKLIEAQGQADGDRAQLIQEASEIRNILTAILGKSQ